MRRFCALIMLLVFMVVTVSAGEVERGPPPDGNMPKHQVDDAAQFFRSAKGTLDKLAGPVLEAVYLGGIRDGAIGASVILILFYLFFLQTRKT